jgi:ATP-dependent DNA helicase RecG
MPPTQTQPHAPSVSSRRPALVGKLRSGRLTRALPMERPEGHEPTLMDRVGWLKGCTAGTAARLEKLEILNVHDLLTHFPRRYSERRSLNTLQHGESQVVAGRVIAAQSKTTRNRRMKIIEVLIDQDGFQLKLIFFNQPWLAKKLTPGTFITATGQVDYNFGEYTMRPTKWDFAKPVAAAEGDGSADGSLAPEYPLTEGLENEEVVALIEAALGEYLWLFPDVVPAELIASMRLMPVRDALRQVHQPQSPGHRDAAIITLKFREFYLLESGLALKHNQRIEGDDDLIFTLTAAQHAAIQKVFPFAFTGAQTRAVAEILGDMDKPGRMNRLLQGDVGSGKTAVALYAALAAVENGHQVAILAPTEILARQHFNTFSTMLRGHVTGCGGKQVPLQTRLLLGGMVPAERDATLEALAAGRIHILAGTHAMLEPRVEFHRLGLMIVDEQHKFGVRQRSKLYAKGNRPHRLVMSATPIPRTLSLTVYGDLDLTIIDEMPPGRIPPVTSWVPDEAREKTLGLIAGRLEKGEQAYFIEPLVEPNEKLEVANAVERFEELRARYGKHGVELVHGQMRSEEKAGAMARFNAGTSRVLVATVVVEVGVDVPAANIMVIHNAERFGLSQLHQLRGRIGRGGSSAAPSLFLFTGRGPGGAPLTEDAVARITTLCRTTDGFAIAEADLKLRGFGDFMGTRQSGIPKLRIGDPAEDIKILARARQEAFARIGSADLAELSEAIALAFGRQFALVDA